MIALLHDDGVAGMSTHCNIADLIVTDPPYNIGFDYRGEYVDKLTPEAYQRWTRHWLVNAYNMLTPHGTLWVAMSDENVAELKVAATDIGFYLRSWVVWYYTFGVASKRKFARSHTHLLYLTKHKRNFTFNTDVERVPSARQTKYNDKRANPDGKLLDDTWIIPRVCGTFKERVPGIPNQLPEALVSRIINICSNEGGMVCDPFSGSGTVAVVAKKLHRNFIGWEQSEKFHTLATQRIEESGNARL